VNDRLQNVQADQAVQNVWNDLNYLNGWNSDEDRPIAFDPEGSSLDRCLPVNNTRLLSAVGRYPLIDDLGNIVIDVATIGVRPIVKFYHLLAFFLGVGFHRS